MGCRGLQPYLRQPASLCDPACTPTKQEGVVDMDDDDEEDEDGDEPQGGSFLHEISPRLWLSAEGRERWRAALEPPAAPPAASGDTDGDADGGDGEGGEDGGEDGGGGGGGGGAGGAGPSAARVAACLTALRQHASLFAPVRAAEKDKAKAAAAAAARAEQVAARAAYYHASSGVSPQHVARRKGQGGPGGCAK